MRKNFLITIIVLFVVIPVYAEQKEAPQEGIDYFHNKALELKDKGEYREAESIFKQILAAQPGNPNVHFDLGNVYLSQCRYAEAVGCYRNAIQNKLDKKLIVYYHFNIALAYIGLGKNEYAISHLKQCIKINPEYDDAKKLLPLVEDSYKNNTRLEIKLKDSDLMDVLAEVRI